MRLKNQVNAAGFERVNERFGGKLEDIVANMQKPFKAEKSPKTAQCLASAARVAQSKPRKTYRSPIGKGARLALDDSFFGLASDLAGSVFVVHSEQLVLDAAPIRMDNVFRTAPAVFQKHSGRFSGPD